MGTLFFARFFYPSPEILVFFRGSCLKPGFALGEVRGFRFLPILGCYVTKFAPHLVLMLIAPGRPTGVDF
jgi:hypothetical protein